MASSPPAAVQPPHTVTFHDIDDVAVFETQYDLLHLPATKNFMIKFDADSAQVSVDLDPDQLLSLFQSNDIGAPPMTRWLNFWAWDSSFEPALGAIAQKYRVGPRLAGLIWPKTVAPSPSPPQASAAGQTSCSDDDLLKPTLATPARPDVEKGIRSRGHHVHHRLQHHRPPVPSTDAKVAFGNIAEELWHFQSVDSDEHYLHIGYNQLYVPEQAADKAAYQRSNRPTGIRIWTSILLCDDGTVISVSAPPPPALRASAEISHLMRRHVLDIFKHISKIHMSDIVDDLFRASVRPQKPHVEPDHEADAAASHSRAQLAASKTASLLFYYLFDDWFTSYRREGPYRETLEKLRSKMFQSADVDLIHSLHQVGRQLGVLKLMYQSYEQVVLRILYSQRTPDLNAASHVLSPFQPMAGITSSPQPGRLHSFNTSDDFHSPSLRSNTQITSAMSESVPHGSRVRLSTGARVRFERLLDRIRLFALTELENCLKEKEELVFMNFNLVALRESHTVEKLTRTTILLAKVTVVFLPVSLMTGYFSLSIGNIDTIYSLRTYWFSFLVVLVVTVAFLFVFGIAGYTVSGQMGYRSLAQFLWDTVVSWCGRRKSKHDHDAHDRDGNSAVVDGDKAAMGLATLTGTDPVGKLPREARRAII